MLLILRGGGRGRVRVGEMRREELRRVGGVERGNPGTISGQFRNNSGTTRKHLRNITEPEQLRETIGSTSGRPRGNNKTTMGQPRDNHGTNRGDPGAANRQLRNKSGSIPGQFRNKSGTTPEQPWDTGQSYNNAGPTTGGLTAGRSRWKKSERPRDNPSKTSRTSYGLYVSSVYR